MFQPSRPFAKRNAKCEMSPVATSVTTPGASDEYKESISGDGTSYSCSWTPPSPHGIPGKKCPQKMPGLQAHHGHGASWCHMRSNVNECH